METSGSSRSCKKCGATESPRWNGRECWECQKARVAEWKRANRGIKPSCISSDEDRRRAREYAQANPEPYRIRAAKHYASNRDKIRAANRVKYATDEEYRAAIIVQSKAWREANAEQKKVNDSAWLKANPEKGAEYRHRRRAALKNAPGSHTASEWKAVPGR